MKLRTWMPALAAALSIAVVAGCGRDPVPVAAPAPAITDKQAIDAATANERLYQDALAKGDLAFLAACEPGAPDSVRLVEMADDDSQGYSLAMTADARGAVAIWQGINHVGGGKYQAFGPQGMRLDGNGWRQVRQSLTEAPFVTGNVMTGHPFVRPPPSRAFLVFCLEGKRGMATASDHRAALDRIAVKMRRLAGNYYSPPGSSQQ